MVIERKNNEIIIRLSSRMSPKKLQQLTDYLRYIEIAENSQAKKADLDQLVAEVKKSRRSKKVAA
jgi:hypothetical protein